MTTILVPLVGPFHLRSPRYNVVGVREAVAAERPSLLLVAGLADGAFTDPAWQDLEEPALTMTLAPWARRSGVPLLAAGGASPDPEAAASFDAIVADSDVGQAALAELRPAREVVAALLSRALTLPRIVDELLPALAAWQAARSKAFGEGPGTDWITERARQAADGVLRARQRASADGPIAVAAGVDLLPAFTAALDRAQVDWRWLREAEPSEAARARSLIDHALVGPAQDPESLLSALRELSGPEAAYARAEVLLRHGHAAEAAEALREASHQDLHDPPQLPGWVLARLGQLEDLAGRRDAALRAYRGVLALSWAPAAAREAAHAGMRDPFRLPDTEADVDAER